jgi:hypothetical protein
VAASQRVDTLRAVARLLGTFARQVELKRALEATEREPHLDFWRVIYGGLSNLAVIEWCKLFGSDTTNALHWKRVFPDRQEEFRAGLLDALGIGSEAFTRYWADMKQWRDKDFAHHDPHQPRPEKWPHFGIAAEAADYYYDWVVAELNEVDHNMFPASLRDFRQTVRLQFETAAVLALASTKDLPPTRY